MKEYVTTTAIAASPERVWEVLTDGAGYAAWNPEIVGIDGAIAPNARIMAHVRLGSGVVRRVSQRVRALEAPRRRPPAGDRAVLGGAQAAFRNTLGSR